MKLENDFYKAFPEKIYRTTAVEISFEISSLKRQDLYHEFCFKAHLKARGSFFEIFQGLQTFFQLQLRFIMIL